jgi:cytoskeleton protein RodZ
VSEQQAQIPSAAAGEPGPGAALLAERRRQNLSLGDVSRQLKLSVRQVEALERDDFAGFQSAVFVHGFMRNYAKLLGLDPQPLIESADRIMKPVVPVARDEAPRAAEPAAARARKPLWPVAAIVAVLVVGIFFVVGRGKEATAPAVEEEKQVAAAPEPERAAPEPAREKPAAAQPAASDEPKREADEADKPKVAEKPKAAETPAPAPAPALPIAEAQAADAGDVLVVRMIFEQESWVEIKDRNGNTVFGQLNPAGSRRSARGEPPLTVVIGNAAGVRLFQGAKNVEVDLGPHTRVDVARLTLE